MKKFSFILLAITLMSCSATKNNLATKEQDEAKISTILNAWHKAAAEANFETYFSHFTSDAIFIGTDASEIWNKQEFSYNRRFRKPKPNSNKLCRLKNFKI